MLSIHRNIDVDVQTVINDLAKLGSHRLQFVLQKNGAYLTLQLYNSCAELRLVENILGILNANQTINILFSKPTCLALLGANTWSRCLVINNTYHLLLSN